MSRRRSHQRKKRYRTPEAAAIAALRYNWRVTLKFSPLEAYPCRYCPRWHIGHTKKEDWNMEAHCFKCREKREIKDPQQVTLKNGRPAARGACSQCGTKVFRIGKAS